MGRGAWKGGGAGDSDLGNQLRGGGCLVKEEEKEMGPREAAVTTESKECVGMVFVRENRDSSELNVSS